jgi:hypothetical protein
MKSENTIFNNIIPSIFKHRERRNVIKYSEHASLGSHKSKLSNSRVVKTYNNMKSREERERKVISKSGIESFIVSGV